MPRRLAILLTVLIAVAGGALGGHAARTAGSPDRVDDRSLRRAAELVAFAPAYVREYSDEWRDGSLAGAADGIIDGEDRGFEAGLRDGGVAAREASADLAAARRAEAEATARVRVDPDPSGDVLVVGDSLEVLTSPYLQRYLPNVRLTIEAHGGFSSLQLYDEFEQSFLPSHDVVVFDAGTNDNPQYPEILQGRLAAVAQAVGSRCMVVPTIHSYVVDGVGDAGKNSVVRAFAASRPGTQTPDWQAAVAEHPEAMQPDDLHPNPEGADLRARLIAEGVKACLQLDAGLAP